MNILIDECVPKPIIAYLVGHNAKTAQEMGWASVKNGELLRLAESAFDLFITSDKNIRYQQNVKDRKISILVLSTNKWRVIENSITTITVEILQLTSGEYKEIKL
jgi:hypothetical protein